MGTLVNRFLVKNRFALIGTNTRSLGFFFPNNSYDRRKFGKWKIRSIVPYAHVARPDVATEGNNFK